MASLPYTKAEQGTTPERPHRDDLAFIEAWEKGEGPRSIDAGTILRVRQLRRVNPKPAPRPIHMKAKGR